MTATDNLPCPVIKMSNHDINIVNRSYENTSQYKYFGMTETNENSIQEEVKSGLNFWNA
jgi:hypothetical protein